MRRLLSKIGFVLVLGASTAFAQTETIIHSFQQLRVPGDGASPAAGQLIQAADGDFYGTTPRGGSSRAGAVFKMTPSGAVTILHSFGDGSVVNDGQQPVAGLIQASDGNFYGTTLSGGAHFNGAVFKMTPSGKVTILHSFQDGTTANDGAAPLGPLVQAADGNLYGTTSAGGAYGPNTNFGTVFRITTAGTLTVIHSFNHDNKDGFYPYAGLAQASDGNLYGTTDAGGSANAGTVFRITPSGVESVIHSFADGSVPNDGQSPQSGLIQATDGKLYGTTTAGGSSPNGGGTVFQISVSGAESVIHSFIPGAPTGEGYNPQGGVIQGGDGNLYGTTYMGGNEGPGLGTVFKLAPSGVLTVLHVFLSPDGFYPQASLFQGRNGFLYGTTSAGGIASAGTVFGISTSGTYRPVHEFQQTAVAGDGMNPKAGLIKGADGSLYGTTVYGGAANLGSVFKVDTTGKVTTLHSFSVGPLPKDGSDPQAGLILASDGNFYGTTAEGGTTTGGENFPPGFGTVFKMTPAGDVTILHNFQDGSVSNDGSGPEAGLLEGPDGDFYGTTSAGGTENKGVIFKISRDGAFTLLHSFTDAKDSLATLIRAGDGYFYGTTYSGGTYGKGVIYRFGPSGEVNIVHNFGDPAFPNDGIAPAGALVQASDGNLYGTTEFGGAFNSGALFKLDATGAVSILHSFNPSNQTDGFYPEATLIQTADGSLCGTTITGGHGNSGVVFKITLSGAETIPHAFDFRGAGDDGGFPIGALLEDKASGTLYGTTFNGGATSQTSDSGTIFQIQPAR